MNRRIALWVYVCLLLAGVLGVPGQAQAQTWTAGGVITRVEAAKNSNDLVLQYVVTGASSKASDIALRRSMASVVDVTTASNLDDDDTPAAPRPKKACTPGSSGYVIASDVPNRQLLASLAMMGYAGQHRVKLGTEGCKDGRWRVVAMSFE